MVFFTCNHCGTALKKNKVEKHYAVECHKPTAVSCMDCIKDFYGDEYVSHNKCVTEQQKYSGQPIDDKTQLGKGERKQMEWVETVRQIIETKGSSLTSQERQLLERLKDFENIPRKKKKFENFLKSAVGRYVDSRTTEKVWSLLEAEKVSMCKKEVPGTEESSPTKADEMEPMANEQPDQESETTRENSPKETVKLSRKEKKEMKKKQKYELELESIAKEKEALESDKNIGEVDMELDEGEPPEEVKVSKSKKKKKKDRDEEEQNAEENIEAPLANGTKKREGKKGKRKHNGDNVEDDVGDKKRKKGAGKEADETVKEDAGVGETDLIDDMTEEIKKKRKFKWDKTILAILQTVPDHELPVKRLRKKVLSEYQETSEGKYQELSFEEALGTFERKLHKLVGVKVHKDRAKLVKSS